MNFTPYEIKDNCRKNLTKYTIKAFSFIPKIENPLILDIGCGTGVPTLALLEICNGIVYAVDSDKSCLLRLKEKVETLHYTDRVKIINTSILKPNLFENKFDIILAEGSLHLIGFEKGLSIIKKYLKSNGYLIIHDELQNDIKKKALFEKNDLQLLHSFELNEDVWWNEYYSCLEHSIKKINNDSLFEKDIQEINEYKKDSHKFRSIYYVLRK